MGEARRGAGTGRAQALTLTASTRPSKVCAGMSQATERAEQAADLDRPESPVPGAPERPAIEVRDAFKTFRLPHGAPSTLKERLLHPLRRTPVEVLTAVRDVSFDVEQGECFGIVGRNGSGKSTVLKLIAGIYSLDAGAVHVDGRLSPFIELGAGFNPELAARDNVLINGTLLGLSRAETMARFDSIIEFAELEEFVDLKLRNYSSGMHVRLAFSTAIHADPDILLLDEVLAVGDVGFQQKCFNVFRTMKDERRTIVLVTHNLGFVREFCDRALLIERGRCLDIGEPGSIVRRYMAMMAEGEGKKDQGPEESRTTDGSAEIRDAWFEDSAQKRTTISPRGEPLTVKADVEFHTRVEMPVFGVQVHSEYGPLVMEFNTSRAVKSGEMVESYDEGDRVHVEISCTNWLGAGRYLATPYVIPRPYTRPADMRRNMLNLEVTGEAWTGAVLDPPHEIQVTRA
jgi:ABC-2 type transport system ATP-binding protein